MGRGEIEKLKNGVVKRKGKRALGLFIDGISLDRATRRQDRKVDLGRLVASITEGLVPEVARYYTLVPYEDDARQVSFLSAVEKAGLEVVAKRLPPKTVQRKVAMDVHMSTDLMLFATGQFENRIVHNVENKTAAGSGVNELAGFTDDFENKDLKFNLQTAKDSSIQRTAIILCPSLELSYAVHVCSQFGVETMLVDFGSYSRSDTWRGIDKWVDLSTSETIWRS